MKIIMSHSQTPEGPLVESGSGCPGLAALFGWPYCFCWSLPFEWWGGKYKAGNQKEMLMSILLSVLQRPPQGLRTILREII